MAGPGWTATFPTAPDDRPGSDREGSEASAIVRAFSEVVMLPNSPRYDRVELLEDAAQVRGIPRNERTVGPSVATDRSFRVRLRRQAVDTATVMRDDHLEAKPCDAFQPVHRDQTEDSGVTSEMSKRMDRQSPFADSDTQPILPFRAPASPGHSAPSTAAESEVTSKTRKRMDRQSPFADWDPQPILPFRAPASRGLSPPLKRHCPL